MNDSFSKFVAFTNHFQPVLRSWKQSAAKQIESAGISVSMAFMVIGVYKAKNGISQKELAEAMGINQGAMVRLIDRAVEAAYVKRVESPEDRRYKYLHILKEGELMAIKCMQEIDKVRNLLLEGVDHDEIEIAIRVLKLFDERAHAYLNNCDKF